MWHIAEFPCHRGTTAAGMGLVGRSTGCAGVVLWHGGLDRLLLITAFGLFFLELDEGLVLLLCAEGASGWWFRFIEREGGQVFGGEAAVLGGPRFFNDFPPLIAFRFVFERHLIHPGRGLQGVF